MNFKLLAILIALLMYSCLYEPAPINYLFSIKNKTQDTLNIESQTINDNKVILNKIFPGNSHMWEIAKLHCYEDYYKDSLIFKFFEVLVVKQNNNKLKTEFFQRKNWKETINLKGSKCSGGNLSYEIEVTKFSEN